MPDADGYQRRVTEVGVELERLALRLGRLSSRSWRTHRRSVDLLLAELVGLAGRQQARDLPVPVLEDHVMAAAVAVVGREVLDALVTVPDEALLDAIAASIETALTTTRSG